MANFSPEQMAQLTQIFGQMMTVALRNLPAPVVNVPAPVVNVAPAVGAGAGQQRQKATTAKPREYGGGKDYRDFKRECTIYILANVANFSTDESKILFVLSYLKEGSAAGWAANYVTQATNAQGMVTIADTFSDFLDKLDASFDDPNKKAKAIQKLNALRQGNHSADEFFQQFEILRSEAGMVGAAYDATLINVLEIAVNDAVFRGVASADNTPTTYDDWKKKAIAVDHAKERIRERNMRKGQTFMPRRTGMTMQGPQQRPQQRPQMPTTSSRPPTALHDQRDASRTTFSGRGQPMDWTTNNMKTTRVCYACGEPGHFIADCRKRQSVRTVFTERRIICFACGEQGHIARVCPKLREGREEEARAVTTEEDAPQDQKSESFQEGQA